MPLPGFLANFSRDIVTVFSCLRKGDPHNALSPFHKKVEGVPENQYLGKDTCGIEYFAYGDGFMFKREPGKKMEAMIRSDGHIAKLGLDFDMLPPNIEK